MKDRILSVAVALSLIAVLFVAVPSTTEAAIEYTGTVQTTDDEGESKVTYFRGDPVYVNVETFYLGEISNETIVVQLQNAAGTPLSQFTAATGDPEPEAGVYESWSAVDPHTLSTNHAISGEIAIYDIVLFIDPEDVYAANVEVDRVQIVVKNTGLFIDPDTYYYYPDQEIHLSVLTGNTEDFYVQVVNQDNYTDEYKNWTSIDAGDLNGEWYMTWVIPSAIPDGTYDINARSEDSDTIWYSEEIVVQKYILIVDCSSDFVLPGQTVRIIYDVIDRATLTHYTGAEIEWNAFWVDIDGDNATDSGTLDSAPGAFNFTVAEDIALYSDIDMMFWANESDDRSAETGVSMTLGSLLVDFDLSGSTYTPGDDVGASVHAMVGMDPDNPAYYDNLAGAEVDLEVSKNDTLLAEYGTTDMVTDVTGMVEYEFMLDPNATKGTYVVAMTLTYLDYEVERMLVFEVVYSGMLVVEFGKEVYYSGQVATIDFKVVWNGVELDDTSVFYLLYGDYGLLATGNSTTGTAEFDISPDYIGTIIVEAGTIVDGTQLSGGDSAHVYIASLVLYPIAEHYRPGDTVTWVYEIATEIADGTIRYVVVDDSGVRVASSNLEFATSGSFDFEVPETDPSESYTATVTLDDGLGHLVTEDSDVQLLSDYELRIWIDDSAGYTSRAFEPGDTIVFGFSITAVGVEDLEVYRIYYIAEDQYVEGNVLVADGTSGTFEYVLNENTNDGEYWLYAWLQNPTNDEWLDGDLFDPPSASVSFEVKGDQSLWDKSVGGLSLFDVTVLVLLLIMVILLVLVPMIKARMDAAKNAPEEPKSMEHLPPEPAETPPEEPEPPTS